MCNLNMRANDCDNRLIACIVARAVKVAKQHKVKIDALSLTMDITVCHLNARKLDLLELWRADDGSFVHDVFGIRSHLNRDTGKLEHCFLPRFATNKR